MATICQTCGVTGFTELLIYCSECQVSAEHRYCLDGLPKDYEVEVHWLCEQCKPSSDMEGGSRIADSASSQQKEVGSSVQSPRECFEDKESRRKLILDDVDNLDEDAQSDHFHQDALNKHTLQMNDPLLVSQSSMHAQDSSNSTGSLHEEVESRVQSPRVCCEDKKSRQKRRKLLFSNVDRSDEEAQSDHFHKDVLNKSMVQLHDPLLVSQPSEPAQNSSNNIPEKVMDMLQIASGDLTHTQETGHVETCDAQLNMSCHQESTEQPIYLPARPIIHHIWRGCFNICNEEYGPLTAHLSSRACEKVRDLAEVLPSVLRVEKISRLDAWPSSFVVSPPTDDNIALYFFPEGERVESFFNQLLDDVINKDLVLKVILDEVELLVFSSIILPENYHKFLGRYYPWGVFRRRKDPSPRPNEELTEETQKMGGSRHGGEEVEAESRVAECIDHVSGNGNDASLSPRPMIFGTRLVPSPTLSAVCPEAKEHADEGPEQSGVEEEVESRDAKSSEECFTKSGDDATLNLFGRRLVPVPSSSAAYPSELKELANEEHDTEDLERAGAKEEAEYRNDERSGLSEEVNYFDVSGTGEGGGACLQLFPTGAEDMAFTARVSNDVEVRLDLGLGWSSPGGVDNDRHFKLTATNESPRQIILDLALI